VARIRLAEHQPEGVTVAEFVDVTDLVGAGERYLHERAVPPASQVLPDDFRAAVGGSGGPVVLDCPGFDSFGSAGLALLVSLWRSCDKADRRLVFCLGKQSHDFFRIAKMDQLATFFRDVPSAVAAAKA